MKLFDDEEAGNIAGYVLVSLLSDELLDCCSVELFELKSMGGDPSSSDRLTTVWLTLLVLVCSEVCLDRDTVLPINVSSSSASSSEEEPRSMTSSSVFLFCFEGRDSESSSCFLFKVSEPLLLLEEELTVSGMKDFVSTGFLSSLLMIDHSIELLTSSNCTSVTDKVLSEERISVKRPSITKELKASFLSQTGHVQVGFFSFIKRKKEMSKHCM